MNEGGLRVSWNSVWEIEDYVAKVFKKPPRRIVESEGED